MSDLDEAGRPCDGGPSGDHSKSWIGLVLASPVVAGLIALIVAWAPWDHGGKSSPTEPATQPVITQPALTRSPQTSLPGDYNPSVYVNPTSGAGGTSVVLSGEDFPPDTKVVFRFSTTVMGETRTNSAGKFSRVAVTIPTDYGVFAPKQFTITGEAGAFTAETPFELTG